MINAHFLMACLCAATITGLLIAILRPLAGPLGLVDIPTDRKRHLGAVPLIGGLAMYGGIVAGTLYFGQLGPFRTVVIETAAVMAIIGALDDRHDLSVRVRLVAQVACVVCVMFSTGVHITTLGHLFGMPVELGAGGYVLTVVAVIGLLNAFNMMDGIDGLAGSQALVSVVTLLAFHGKADLPGIVVLLSLLGSAALPYLLVNLGFTRRKVFLGDAGSMVVGYLLAWALIRMAESSDSPVSPTDVLWCVALPVLDTLTVMTRRLSHGASPFKPDRGHIHHLLLARGLTPRQALIVLVGLSTILSCIGSITRRLPGETNLMTFLAVTVVYTLIVVREYRRTHPRSQSAVVEIPPVQAIVKIPLTEEPEPAIAD
ncbi:hypothetical protein KPL74_01700 [Bacillus sp. NP157]|nr:hypothetical protein KPL74_01700 [Bacillus sp. NP157]